jgi:hypothetical protein
MARIPGVPARAAGLRVRLVYFFTRRHFARLTGRAPGRVIEPLEIYAHAPGLLRGYGRLSRPPRRRGAWIGGCRCSPS